MISFIIPAYNAGKTIGRAINSIINQEQNSIDYEVIVVDDGSDDDLREKVEEFRLPKTDIKRTIILIRKEKITPALYPSKAGIPSKSPLN